MSPHFKSLKRTLSRLHRRGQSKDAQEKDVESDSPRPAGNPPPRPARSPLPLRRRPATLLNPVRSRDTPGPAQRTVHPIGNAAARNEVEYAEHPGVRPLSQQLDAREPLQRPNPSSHPSAARRSSRSSSVYSDDTSSRDSFAMNPPYPAQLNRKPVPPPGAERTLQALNPESDANVGGVTHRLQGMNLTTTMESVDPHAKADVNYTTDVRQAVVQQEIRPHEHTIYQPRRTRSIHYHEHRYHIQPIIDPEPEVLPTTHYLQDSDTGMVYKLPGTP